MSSANAMNMLAAKPLVDGYRGILRTTTLIDAVDAVISSQEYQDCNYFRDQVKVLKDSFRKLRKEHGKDLWLRSATIAAIYSVPEKCIENQLYHISKHDKKKANGRPFSLNDEQLEKLKDFAEMSDFPRTKFEFVLFISNIIQKTPDAKLVNKALEKIGYKVTSAKPMESNRYNLDIKGLYNFYDNEEEYFDKHSIPARFIFNLDEEGHSAQADARQIYVIVKKSFNRQAYYPMDKTQKRVNFLGCINGSGEFIKPVIIMPRKTINIDLLAQNFAEKIVIAYNESGFITQDIFMRWFKDVFINHVEEQRRKYRYNGPAVLFLDGAMPHAYPKLCEKCAAHNIRALLFPAHTSHVVQPLDLVVFHVHKSYIRKNLIDISDEKLTERLLKLYSTWQAAATLMNINAAWRSMGVTFIPTSSGTTIVKIRLQRNSRIQKAIAAAS